MRPATMPDMNLTRTALRTPKAAAIAGIVFSILAIAIFLLLRLAFPAHPVSPTKSLGGQATPIAVAISLTPFAGVAFLWFIGVVRDRLGEREDRLFATVFLGSGLLFLAMFFCAGAAVSSTVLAFSSKPDQRIDPETFVFARSLAFNLMQVYAIKMAAVFMFVTSTLAAFTRFVPRYVAYLGYLLALMIIFGSQFLDWSFLAFPLWVLLLSGQILYDNYRSALSPGR